MTDKVVVLVNCSNLEEAGLMGRHLVAKRLAACVNLVPGVRSWYWWEGKVVDDNEVMIMIKTSRQRLAELEKEVVRLPLLCGARSDRSPSGGRLSGLPELD